MAQTLHATCVSLHDNAVLITGASGSGKSTIGLQLMALGCDLVSDDRTILEMQDGQVMASCPATLSGLIEARGVGLLEARPVARATVRLVVDLDRTTTDRLPERGTITLLERDLPLIWRADGPQFVPALLQFLKTGWSDR